MPFQRCVTELGPPTAKHNEVVGHAVAASVPLGGATGLGLLTIAHTGAAPVGNAPDAVTSATRDQKRHQPRTAHVSPFIHSDAHVRGRVSHLSHAGCNDRGASMP